MDMPPMMMMPMYFFSSTTWNSYLLFKEARMDSTSKFWVALILTFIAGAFTTIFAHISKDWELAYYEARESGRREQRLGYYRWLIGVMVALRMATHYLAMLLAMSYNVPLFIALCIGAPLLSPGYVCLLLEYLSVSLLLSQATGWALGCMTWPWLARLVAESLPRRTRSGPARSLFCHIRK